MQLIMLLMAAQSAAAQAAPTGVGADSPPLVLQFESCPRSANADEIVICGRNDQSDRYRIPEMFRGQNAPGDRVPGIGPVSLDDNPFAPCGIFQGERRCNKAEASLYGYGGGRDPLSVAGRVVEALSDPE